MCLPVVTSRPLSREAREQPRRASSAARPRGFGSGGATRTLFQRLSTKHKDIRRAKEGKKLEARGEQGLGG